MASRAGNAAVHCTSDPAVRSIPALVHSSLSHHITAVRLDPYHVSDVPVTFATFRHLRSLPQLTKLDIAAFGNDAAGVLLQGTSSTENAAQQLQAALPTSLRSFGFTARPAHSMEKPYVNLKKLGSAFLAAATTMTQLTELRIGHVTSWNDEELEALAALPLLRKLTLSTYQFGTPLSGLKRLSQLRELTRNDYDAHELKSLCEPPHSLQLQTLSTMCGIGEYEMGVLLHLPTLTQPGLIHPDAFPLLAEVPRLRRLTISPTENLTDESVRSLVDALAGCTALDDLTLTVSFENYGEEGESEEELRTLWTDILRSVPKIKRLVVRTEIFPPLLAVLPTHLPRLERLALEGCSDDALTQLAHPTLQQLELKDDHRLKEAEVQSLLHNSRLPKLSSCQSVLWHSRY